MKTSEARIYVWDPLVRLFHWGLVAAFALAYFTGEDSGSIHVAAGYAIAALLVVRVIWGFVGSRSARFSDFLRGPRETARYLRDLLLLRAERHLGHSPAGGAMILALLLSLTVTLASGLVVYGADERAGPLAGLFAPVTAASSLSSRNDEGRAEEEGDGPADTAEEIHEIFANITVALALLHVAAVIFASFAFRENLIGSMITGYKRREPSRPDAPSSEDHLRIGSSHPDKPIGGR
jgi:cytochrome b